MERSPAIYILESKRNGILYISMISDLVKRVWDHKQNLGGSYPKIWYGVHTLVYFEMHSEMIKASSTRTP